MAFGRFPHARGSTGPRRSGAMSVLAVVAPPVSHKRHQAMNRTFHYLARGRAGLPQPWPILHLCNTNEMSENQRAVLGLAALRAILQVSGSLSV